MSGVEALEQITTTTETPALDPGGSSNLDAELDSIWDRANVTNGADRGDNGKFVSPNPEPVDEPANPAQQVADTPSLEGEKGEGQLDGSTPVDVPLPANRLLNSLDAEWSTLSPELQQKLTERSNELHSRMTDMGQQISRFKPLQEAAGEFAEYFNGNLTINGQSISPADGVRYLANIQRAMDRDPLPTLLSIADTYNLREELAKMFGGQVQAVPAEQQVLLREIAELKQTIAGMQSPAKIEQVLEQRETDKEISRFASEKPLWNHVVSDLPFFIHKAKAQLGEGAGRLAVLDKAYTMAVEADPALRAQTQAAPRAAADDARKAEAAKRASSVNVTSTSSGKAREPSLDDELSAIWEKSRKA